MKVGIVCCSNGQSLEQKGKIDQLIKALSDMGLEPVLGKHIYLAEGTAVSGTPQERAADMNAFHKDRSISLIFDISGGDAANEILPYLDYEAIRMSQAMFWGYSDLTAVINAIYARTGKPSFLYQVKNLIWEFQDIQRKRFQGFIHTTGNKEDGLFDYRYEILQGGEMHGLSAGGNIRCLLKLAGTPYWPEIKDHVLVLEAFGGGEAQVRTYFSQLEQIGVFSLVQGILLGTFTKLEEEKGKYYAYELLKPHISDAMAVARTSEIGHGMDSKAIVIGGRIDLVSHAV